MDSPGSPLDDNTLPSASLPWSLPADKLFHVMFSFQSEDRVWVRSMLETLEAPPYNLKCCFADRDFHPGKDVMENIEVCMHQSMNNVLVISPEHLESHYCDFETNMAIELAHEKKGKVIPVLRRGETVPGSLRFINYIDARDGVNECEVVEKLARAILEGLDKKIQSTAYNFADKRFTNGDEVTLTGTTADTAAPCSLTALGMFTSLSGVDPTHMQTCRTLEINVTEEEVAGLRSLANGCSFVRDHWLLYTHPGRFVLWLAVTVWIWSFCGTVVIASTPSWVNRVWPYFISLLPLASGIAGGVALSGIALSWRTFGSKQKGCLAGLVSQQTYRNKLLLAIGDDQNNLVLRFIRYDVINCQEYIRQHLVPSSLKNDDAVNSDDMTRLILEAGIARYIKVLMDSRPKASRSRHPVRRDVVCLCQYIEMEQIHLNVQKCHCPQESIELL